MTTKTPKILIVEDDEKLAAAMRQHFFQENMLAEVATGFDKALAKPGFTDYTCVVLALGLPGGNGLDMIRDIRHRLQTGGLLITAGQHSLDNLILGLDMGADDYLTKPFYLPELSARVAAIVRRKTANDPNIIRFKDLWLNIYDRTAMAHNQLLDLTRKEYDILLYFIGNRNTVVSKTAIAKHLWGEHPDAAEGFDFLYSHIKNLRKKLALAGCPDYIISLYGRGYKLTGED